jgi:hypothetical protein
MDDGQVAQLVATATGGGSPDARITACDRLVRAGRFDVAEPPLADLSHTPPVAPVARRLLAVCRQLRRWGIVGQLERYAGTSVQDDGRPDFSDDASVLVARRPNASKVIFVFTGAARQVWVSLHVLHQVLPEDCHIVYLRDTRQLCYLTGVEGLGTSYDETLAEFRRLIDSLGGSRVYCIGSSGGGYGALRFGLDLGARAVLAFAPSTDASSLAPLFKGTALEGITDRMPHVFVDIAQLYAAAPAPPSVTLVFGDRQERDAAASRRLSGLSMVTIHPVADYDRHDVIAQTIVTGEFRSLIDGLLSVR